MSEEGDTPPPVKPDEAESRKAAGARAAARARIDGNPLPDKPDPAESSKSGGCLKVILWLIGAAVVFFFLLLGTCALMMR